MRESYVWAPQTFEVLRAVGWTSDRAVDTARWEAEIGAGGFTIGDPTFEPTRRFLAEFGDLEVDDHGPGIPKGCIWFTIAPLAIWRRAASAVRTAERLGVNQVYPIGHVQGHAILVMSDEGEVYVDWGPGHANLGSEREAIARLIQGDPVSVFNPRPS
ncbi:hypothetical protein Aglo03_36460 [Actinokineospora globicatena]|uniref:SUKH-3 immunity protein n=1 Tax=Actinokineospora globicatena TaxID=103729 RepID=A0A9W6QQA2_9PSEU|nr:hypothetical protein Aglo03_36460 [Actinokineospora globicatena]